MKVLVLQHKAGNRFRTVQYYEALEKKGFSFEDPHWDLQSQWGRWLERAREVDVVWIARRLLPAFKLFQLQCANPHIVFDFDDALWLRSSRRESTMSFSKRYKFVHILEVAKVIAAGNDFLADFAKRLVEENKIKVVPTTINRSWYRPREKSERKEFVVGWIGSRATLPYLEKLRDVFEKFNELKIPWKLKVISDAFPEWPHLPVEKKKWILQDEAQDLKDLDVGLNPLSQDDWSRGKCALKALQYMAVASPVIASPVGVNEKIIQHGHNGFLADSESEWMDALKKVSLERECSHEMGIQARQSIWNHYTMEAQVDHLATIFKEAVQ